MESISFPTIRNNPKPELKHIHKAQAIRVSGGRGETAIWAFCLDIKNSFHYYIPQGIKII
jgi:hypothetical protein